MKTTFPICRGTAKAVAALVALAAAGCLNPGEVTTTGGGGDPSNASPVVTAAVSAPDELLVTWTDPTQAYLGTPSDVASDLHRNGIHVGTFSGFGYRDAGLPPDTTCCYDVAVTAVYCLGYGCTSVGWMSDTACATTSHFLRVESIVPAAGAFDVSLASSIVATFNAPLDASSVTSTSFLVSGPSGRVPGLLSVAGASATFTPAAPLEYDATYAITITTGVKAPGASLLRERGFRFATLATIQQGNGIGMMTGVWAGPAPHVFTVGDDRSLVHFDGSVWTRATAPSDPSRAVWGSAADDVLAVGMGSGVMRYDGTGWSPAPPATSYLLGLWGRSRDDVFAAGGLGTIVHFDGTAWSEMTSGTGSTLHGVWATPDRTQSPVAFAVGEDGTITRYDGSSWSATTVGAGEYHFGVWGSSATDVFVASGGTYPWGSGGAIHHHDGSTWTSVHTDWWMHAVWGASATDVFAVGESGTILRYDGSGWTAMPSGTTANLLAVSGRFAADVFAAGDGIVLHWDGASWEPVLPLP